VWWARKVFDSQRGWSIKVRSTSHSSWRLVLGILETETDRGRSGSCRAPFRGGADGPKTGSDTWREVPRGDQRL